MNSNGETLVRDLEGPNSIRDLLKQEQPDYLNDCSMQTIVKDEILDEFTSVLPKSEPFQLKHEKVEPKSETNGNLDGKEQVMKDELNDEVNDEDTSDDDNADDDEEEEESSAESDDGNEVIHFYVKSCSTLNPKEEFINTTVECRNPN